MAGDPELWVRRHALIYGVANAGFLIVDLLTPGPIWFLYPLLFWGGALAMHRYLVKSLVSDPDWAERRTERLRRHSYDIGHIEQIEAAAQGAAQGDGAQPPEPPPRPTTDQPRSGGGGNRS